MPQRRFIDKPKSERTLAGVLQVKPRRKRPGNDNAKTAQSELKFRAARELSRRQADLDWQIRFAQMKLHHWQDSDNWSWDPLNTLLNRATSDRLTLG